MRAAAWLASEIGEGGVFTKEALRNAVPGMSQIDRRVRDLRDYGWIIEESRVGTGLGSSEQRLVKIGAPVWDKAARKAAKRSTINAKTREEVFARDGHACVRCGIAAGEAFDDEPDVKARLTAAHVYPNSLGGNASANDLVTACQRCNEEIQAETHNYFTGDQVWVQVQSLGGRDRERLVTRMRTNRFDADKVDRVWRAYKQLPGAERDRVHAMLEKLVSGE